MDIFIGDGAPVSLSLSMYVLYVSLFVFDLPCSAVCIFPVCITISPFSGDLQTIYLSTYLAGYLSSPRGQSLNYLTKVR